ncbi:MAG: DnaD domain-containing protein [Anaerolineaceae bacterium]
MIKTFPGFSNNKDRLITIPSSFISDLLPIIDHLGELKVTLYTIWFLEHQEGNLRSIHFNHFKNDKNFMAGMGGTAKESLDYLIESLQRASERGSLLCFVPENSSLLEAFFFINSPRGRAAYKAIQKGSWDPKDQDLAVMTPSAERPNIYYLYEANIGPLTPLISEALQEAEEIYPADWIDEAIKIAVENNVRRWRYIEAILKSWKERGRDEKNRRDTQEDSKRFIDGEYGEFFKH